MACQFVRVATSFLNHSLDFPLIELANLKQFQFVNTLHFNCHLQSFNLIMHIFKFSTPEKLIHTFGACHLEVITHYVATYNHTINGDQNKLLLGQHP
jgi:hypothetical protein